MNANSYRLFILPENDIADLYGLPYFSDAARRLFFHLSVG
jgi:hypothetical protein